MTIHPTAHPLHVVVRGLPLAEVARGGPGSGHFGHAGRPGQQGGSAPGGGGGAQKEPYGKYPVHGVASHIAKLQAGQGSRTAEAQPRYSGTPRSRGMQVMKETGLSSKADSVSFQTQSNPFGGDRVTIATVHGWAGTEDEARSLRAALREQGIRTVFYVKARGGGEFSDSEYAR